MKLEMPEVTVTKSEQFEEENFSIGNLALIMDILRNKMYSNPIRAICQEIMSNGRDAHREVGKNDVAIQVKLPNHFDSTFHVRDYGPGITPSRMSEVFIRYGESTKRDDNTQTGGFGLGAKTPFAYTDTFCIVSITPEQIYQDKEGSMHENCMVRRQYVAHIDETRIGKLSLVSSSVSNDAQGTQIIIDVRRNDFTYFENWVRKTAMYWDVKPKVVGSDHFEWKEINHVLSGNNWFLENPSSSSYEYNNMKAIVDGITYDISASDVNIDYGDKNYNKISTLISSPVRITFDVGDLQLTANRENIENSGKNNNASAIMNRINTIFNDIKNVSQKDIDSCSNLWEALIKWKSLKSSSLGKYVDELNYKGKKFTEETTSFALPKNKIEYFLCVRKNNGIEPKIKKGGYLFFTDTSRVYIDDTDSKKPSRGKIATLFNDNPDITDIQVVKYLTTDKKELDEIEEKFFIQELSSGTLSPIEKTKFVYGKRNSTKRRVVKGRILDTYATWCEEDIDLENGCDVYVAMHYGKPVHTDDVKNEYNSVQLSKIVSTYGLKIYGISSMFKNKIGKNWIPLDKWIEEKVEELKQDNKILTYGNEASDNCDSIFNTRYPSLSKFYNELNSDFVKKIKKTDSIVLKYIERSKIIEKIYKEVKEIDGMARIINKNFKITGISKKSEIADLSEKFKNTYPFLASISSFYYYADVLKLKEVTDYINMMDEK